MNLFRSNSKNFFNSTDGPHRVYDNIDIMLESFYNQGYILSYRCWIDFHSEDKIIKCEIKVYPNEDTCDFDLGVIPYEVSNNTFESIYNTMLLALKDFVSKTNKSWYYKVFGWERG